MAGLTAAAAEVAGGSTHGRGRGKASLARDRGGGGKLQRRLWER